MQWNNHRFILNLCVRSFNKTKSLPSVRCPCRQTFCCTPMIIWTVIIELCCSAPKCWTSWHHHPRILVPAENNKSQTRSLYNNESVRCSGAKPMKQIIHHFWTPGLPDSFEKCTAESFLQWSPGWKSKKKKISLNPHSCHSLCIMYHFAMLE